jgi:hypothetical protein
MATHLIEEEEREQAECRLKAQQAAAQKEVRGVELPPVRGVSDAVSLAHGWVASSEVPAAAFCGGAESLSAWCVRGHGSQQKGKGKATAGNGGAGGGPSGKAAAAGSSSGEASTSRGEASRPSTLPSTSAGHRSVVEDAAQAELSSAEAASFAHHADPQLQPAGGGKKEKERQRKERQRQRRMEEAREALQVAIEAMLDARCVRPLCG